MMSEKVYFTEEQRIDQLGIKLFMAALASFSLVPFAWADWGPPVPIETPMTLMGIIFALIFANIVVFAVKFETRITNRGIYYKYPPIVWKRKFISFEHIQDIKMRKYSAWREFGGRGYKSKPFSKLKAIIIKGNDGVVLTYASGKKLLLGTQRPYEFKKALQRARGEESVG
jgi:hypothetical protein